MTAPIIHGIMLQAGNVTSNATSTNTTSISSAVNQIISQIGVPAMQIVLIVGGLSLIASIIMVVFYIVEYLWHPTSFGRTSALTEAILHSKKLIIGPLALFLLIYMSLLAIGLASNNSQITQSAGTYALQILQAMLTETANLFNNLIQHALKTTP
jgi:hypothetical protein